MSVSLMRPTKTSPLHIKSYYNGNLDWDTLDSNIQNC